MICIFTQRTALQEQALVGAVNQGTKTPKILLEAEGKGKEGRSEEADIFCLPKR